jgi:hypothetical protein
MRPIKITPAMQITILLLLLVLAVCVYVQIIEVHRLSSNSVWIGVNSPFQSQLD